MDGVRRNIPGYSMGVGRPIKHGMAPVKQGRIADDPASKLFDHFCNANTCQAIVSSFHQLCDLLELKPSDYRNFYKKLKAKLTSWKAQSLWTKLDKRAAHKEYKKGTACTNTRVLIIGSGPCGLRMAIEVALLGGKAVIIEKRDRFSRNNVLHLWPYLIHDLKVLGAKKFFGKFCAGAIDHISIRTLQCILLKVALLLGVEIHLGASFEGLEEPPADQSMEKIGWRAKISPVESPVSEYEFDVLVGADGKRNTLTGFKRKEFRGKLAIAITANFINRHTQAEASVEEISGVAFIFNQKFFKDLNRQTGIDLENIVYYKDETHYFVMTAKKHSLLYKGVLINDYDDPALLLDRQNVNQEALMLYAREAADVSTNHMLPNLEFAHNHYGQPDVAMFDFTSIFAAENACRVQERNGHKLLIGLVGDSLLEPFWPTGSGCARGFLGCLDAAWMIKRWASGQMTPLQVIAERESIYQLLSQTTPENLSKNIHLYTIDPNTRYPNLNWSFFKPQQLCGLFDGGKDYKDELIVLEEKSNKYEFISDSHFLLKWFQRQLERYRSIVKVTDFTTSWRNGLALCALIHSYHPELVDVYNLHGNEVAKNNQLAFEIAEQEFGISPIMSGEDMANYAEPDKLTMISYLSQFYEYFRKERPAKVAKTPDILSPEDSRSSNQRPRSPNTRLSLFSKISNRIKQRREQEEPQYEEQQAQLLKENQFEVEGLKPQIRPKGFTWEGLTQKRIKEMTDTNDKISKFADVDMKLQEASKQLEPGNLSNIHAGVRGKNKVSAMAKSLASKFAGDDQPVAPPPVRRMNSKPLVTPPPTSASEYCCFCKERLYLMERLSAEGMFFHRGCLKCYYCNTQLRLGSYTFIRAEDGTAKFYCFQHYGLSRPVRRRTRKRSFQERTSQENIPLAVENLGSSPEEESPPPRPRLPKLTPTPVAVATPPSLRDRIDGRGLGLTPERIEYETMSEAEESELEQTQHNLSASLLSLDFEEEEESDSDDEKRWRRYMAMMAHRSSEEDDLDFSDGEMSDDGMTWEECCRLAESMKKKRPPPMLVGKKLLADQEEDEGSSTEVEDEETDSDEEWESEEDDETEKESEGEESDEAENAVPSREDQKLKLTPSYPGTAVPFVDKKPSPSTVEVARNRMNFFAAPTEPVRIDPWKIFGPKKEEKIDEVPESAEETVSPDEDEQRVNESGEEQKANESGEEQRVNESGEEQRVNESGEEIETSAEGNVPSIVVEDAELMDEVAAAMQQQIRSIEEKGSESESEIDDAERNVCRRFSGEEDSGSVEESGTVSDDQVSSRESLSSTSNTSSEDNLVKQYTQVLEEQLSDVASGEDDQEARQEAVSENEEARQETVSEDEEAHHQEVAGEEDEEVHQETAGKEEEAEQQGEAEEEAWQHDVAEEEEEATKMKQAVQVTEAVNLREESAALLSSLEEGEIRMAADDLQQKETQHAVSREYSPGELMLNGPHAEDTAGPASQSAMVRAPDARLELEAELFDALSPTPSPQDAQKYITEGDQLPSDKPSPVTQCRQPEGEERGTAGEPFEGEERGTPGELPEDRERGTAGEPCVREEHGTAGEPCVREEHGTAGEPCVREEHGTAGEPCVREEHGTAGEPCVREEHGAAGEPCGISEPSVWAEHIKDRINAGKNETRAAELSSKPTEQHNLSGDLKSRSDKSESISDISSSDNTVIEGAGLSSDENQKDRCEVHDRADSEVTREKQDVVMVTDNAVQKGDQETRLAPDARLEMEEDLSDADVITPEEEKPPHPETPKMHSSPYTTPKLLPFLLPRQPKRNEDAKKEPSNDIYGNFSAKRSAAADSVKKVTDAVNSGAKVRSYESKPTDGAVWSSDENLDTSGNLVEVVVGEGNDSPKFIVDETYVTGRGRRRKKHPSAPTDGAAIGPPSELLSSAHTAVAHVEKPVVSEPHSDPGSHEKLMELEPHKNTESRDRSGSDTSFTISTPSGSVHSLVSSDDHTGSHESLDADKTKQRESVIFIEQPDLNKPIKTQSEPQQAESADLNNLSDGDLANTTLDRLADKNSAGGLFDGNVTLSDIMPADVTDRRPESLLYRKTLNRDTLQRTLIPKSGDNLPQNTQSQNKPAQTFSDNSSLCVNNKPGVVHSSGNSYGVDTNKIDRAATCSQMKLENVKSSGIVSQKDVVTNHTEESGRDSVKDKKHEDLITTHSTLTSCPLSGQPASSAGTRPVPQSASRQENGSMSVITPHPQDQSKHVRGQNESIPHPQDQSKHVRGQNESVPHTQIVSNGSSNKTIRAVIDDLDTTLDNLVALNMPLNLGSQMDVTLSDLLHDTDTVSLDSTAVLDNAAHLHNDSYDTTTASIADSTLDNPDATIESVYATPDESFMQDTDMAHDLEESPDVRVKLRKSPGKETKLIVNTSEAAASQKRPFELNISPASSPNRTTDAKWKFLAETPKPVRIDPINLFSIESQKTQAQADGREKRQGQIFHNKEHVECEDTAVTPEDFKSIGDVFYTPATSVKGRPAIDETPQFKKPTEIRKRLLPKTPAKADTTKTALTAEEIRSMKENEIELARVDARRRARLKSDEDLGLEDEMYDPRINGIKTPGLISQANAKLPVNRKDGLLTASSTSSSDTDKSRSRTVSDTSSESQGKTVPVKNAATASSQPKGSPSTGSDRSGSGRSKSESDHSPALRTKEKSDKDKKKALQKSVSLKSPDEKDAKDGDKKEKRRSFLELLFGGKDKDKEKIKSPEPKESTTKDKSKTEAKDKLSKIKSPEKKSSPKVRTPKLKTPKSKDNKKGKKEDQKTAEDIPLAVFTNAKAKKGSGSCDSPKISFVAKSLAVSSGKVAGSKAVDLEPSPSDLQAPKASIDEDLESDYDDRYSVRSFRSTTSHASLTNEDDFNERTLKRAQRAAKRQQKQREQKRLRMAQELQRKLEEVEMRQHDVEGRGVNIEKALRGEGPEGSRPESELMQEWFNLVHEKNVLVRFESELMVHAKELELQDRQSRLEQALREQLLDGGSNSGGKEAEKKILDELLEVVEQRDALVALIEEDRVREKEEDRDLKAMMSLKGFDISSTSYTSKLKMPNLQDMDTSC